MRHRLPRPHFRLWALLAFVALVALGLWAVRLRRLSDSYRAAAAEHDILHELAEDLAKTQSYYSAGLRKDVRRSEDSILLFRKTLGPDYDLSSNQRELDRVRKMVEQSEREEATFRAAARDEARIAAQFRHAASRPWAGPGRIERTAPDIRVFMKDLDQPPRYIKVSPGLTSDEDRPSP